MFRGLLKLGNGNLRVGYSLFCVYLEFFYNTEIFNFYLPPSEHTMKV